ncbi:hypothetical protein PPTG_19184 [Phytophthora nicotianae INRA-310]|uniref:Uncharacterized protein n=1 Tax=Phytophthora nicotianae (strain INRA-310) TaxID=761204 RepID=W2PE37_PHYN3|nr:hypothetical protein PPTG_19184 [Phytophthora nicotianae INRA-310]ETM98905.1 hypothetical protein PPTG_19184 [Phytophthora nicotianae INRA-310]
MAKGKPQRRAKAQTPVLTSKNADAETKSTTKSTTTACKTASDGSNVHLTLADYRVLVDWLEVKQNFEALQVVSGKTTVGGPPKITKRAACAAMAAYLFAETTNKRLTKQLKPEQMQGRWRTYMSDKSFKAITTRTV